MENRFRRAVLEGNLFLLSFFLFAKRVIDV
jgi:hypothetical protein